MEDPLVDESSLDIMTAGNHEIALVLHLVGRYFFVNFGK